MALPLFKEKRISERKALTGLLPGKMLNVEGQEIHCQPKDLSTHGLGITSDANMEIGSILILKARNKNIQLEVSWVQPGFEKRDQFRYGLTTKDPSVDLEKVFIESGCLK
jgi:hypothetical protein